MTYKQFIDEMVRLGFEVISGDKLEVKERRITILEINHKTDGKIYSPIGYIKFQDLIEYIGREEAIKLIKVIGRLGRTEQSKRISKH